MVSRLLSLAALLFVAGNPSSPPAARQWEKVFDGGADDWVYAVAAVGRDDWFIAVEGAVAKVTKGNIERHATAPRQAEGLFVASRESVYAFGDGELVVHHDGKKWRTEHAGAPPQRPRRRGAGAPDMLQGAYFREATLVAVGPSLVMVRQPDGSWIYPPKAERQTLCDAAESGASDPEARQMPSRGLALAWQGPGLFLLPRSTRVRLECRRADAEREDSAPVR